MTDINNFDEFASVDLDDYLSSFGVEWDEGGVTDSTAPVVTLVSPSEGSPIVALTPLIVDVTDNIGLRRSLLAVQFGGTDATELVHDGDGFFYPYLGSTRDAISGGWRYTLRRSGGWLADLSLHVYAIDTAGLEASE